jgi:UDP-N-acetylmuramoyl-tripeptide--D-alanyl-D-alanine ligase
MKLTYSEAIQATGGTWMGKSPEGFVESVSTDTRTLKPGDAFIALRGENFDGHDYLGRAADAGAALLVVDRADPAAGLADKTPVLLVPDTLRALGDLAKAWRTRCRARRIAIVGSSGKTTTKDMLNAVLRRAAEDSGLDADTVLATEGNHNNLIGLPQTLFRLTPEHRWAVLEMGMNTPGELGRLAEIANPDLLVFLNVGTAHIGMFGSLDGLLHAKAEALIGLRPDATVLFDADSANTRSIIERWAGSRPRKSFSCLSATDYTALDIRLSPGDSKDKAHSYEFDMDLKGAKRTARLGLFGRHNVRNALAAAAAASLVGAEIDSVVSALAGFQASRMRCETRLVAETHFILDCYNANPDSMRAGIKALEDWKPLVAKMRLVLGEMLELGDASDKSHLSLIEPLTALAPANIFLYGPGMRPLFEAWDRTVCPIGFHLNHESLADSLLNNVKPGDLVFFKGSRGCRLEKIAEIVENHLLQRRARINQ